MRCDIYQESIEDRLEGRLPELLAAEFDAHVAACSACAAEVEAVQLVAESLRALPSVSVPAGFQAALHAKLVAAAAEVAPRASLGDRLASWFDHYAMTLRPVLASAASVAAVLLLLAHFEVSFSTGPASVLPDGTPGAIGVAQNASNEAIAEAREGMLTTVSVDRDLLVELEVEAPRDIEEAEFRVAIDPGLVFASDDPEIVSRHELVWNDTLKKGIHRIPIVVRGVQAGRFELNALILGDDEDILTVRNITFDVRGDLKTPGTAPSDEG